MDVIRLERVDFGWTGRPVFCGLDLAIRGGGVTVLMGESGTGKTTLLRLIAGFEAPARGRVTIAGEIASEDGRIVRPPERRGLSMVFQDLALWPHASVCHTLELALGRSARPIERRQRITETLAALGLDHRRDARPAELSGGERQRLALARAIVTRPRIVLMDEPLGNLDRPLRQALMDEIRLLQRRLALTVLYVTHSPHEAFALGDRAMVIHEGRIEQVGTPAELYVSPSTAFVASMTGRCALVPVPADGCDVNAALRSALSSDGGPTPSDVMAVVRPEDVVLDIDGPHAGTVAGSTYAAGAFETEVIGPRWQLWGRFDSVVQPGTPVRFSIRRAAVARTSLPVGEHGGPMRVG